MERGASLYIVDCRRQTPLHLAAAKGGKRLVCLPCFALLQSCVHLQNQLLLEHGASMEQSDAQDLRPIDISVQYANAGALAVKRFEMQFEMSYSLFQMFLRRGAKLSATTWRLADASMILMLLRKLLDDCALLYGRSQYGEAAARAAYALRKVTHVCFAIYIVQLRSPNQLKSASPQMICCDSGKQSTRCT